MKKHKKEGKILNRPDENPVDAVVEDWQTKTLAAESDTKLDADTGEGKAVKLFFFDYTANPETFKLQKPTSQELFNIHLKQIEIQLWQRGWQIFPDVNPRLMFAKDKSHYRIVVAATQNRGTLLREQPQTLTEITHGRTNNSH